MSISCFKVFCLNISFLLPLSHTPPKKFLHPHICMWTRLNGLSGHGSQYDSGICSPLYVHGCYRSAVSDLQSKSATNHAVLKPSKGHMATFFAIMAACCIQLSRFKGDGMGVLCIPKLFPSNGPAICWWAGREGYVCFKYGTLTCALLS